MMGKHLNVVASPLFNIYNQDLLKPERKLHEIVPLEEAIHFPIGPSYPQIAEIEPVIGTVHYILWQISQINRSIDDNYTIPSDQKAP